MPRDPRFIGPSHYLNDSTEAVQRTVNMDVLSVGGPGEDAIEVLRSAPGMQLVLTLASEYFRAIYYAESMLLLVTVSGGNLKLRNLSEGGAPTVYTLGLSSGQPYISIAHGQNQVVIVDGNKGWVLRYSTSGSISSIDSIDSITDPAWTGSVSVRHIDGYFTFIRFDSEQFFISGIDDASDLNALDFSSADAAPDQLVAQEVADSTLYLFGSRTFEPWVNTGESPFPFSRVPGATGDIGCVGPHAVRRLTSGIAWVGSSASGGPSVFTMRGYQPQKISTMAVDQWLYRITNKDQLAVWSYVEDGVEFVGVGTRQALTTSWVWNSSTNTWSERGVYADGNWGPYPVQYFTHRNGFTYAGGINDAVDCKIYLVRNSYTNLGGDPIMRERTFPHLVHPVFEPISYHSLEIRCTSGEASDGAVMTLEISNDGGLSFNAPLSRALGETGKPTQRIRWQALGTSPAGGSRVFRLRCDDDVPLTITGGALNASL